MAEATQSAADLVRQAAEQISTLVRDELRLAQVELAEKAKHAATGAGLFGGAGLTAAYGLGAVLFAAGLALAEVLPGWASALIVAAVLFACAGIAVLVGRRQLRQVTPVLPTRAMESVQADIKAVSDAVEERGRR